jgi:uncharacterized protein
VTTQASEVVTVSPDTTYAPEFAVVVEGQPVDETTKNDVLDIHVVRDIENMASFDLTFNNWDDKLLRFKYSESDDDAFAMGRRVDIRLGYADRLVSVVTGQIVGLRPSFPESSSPTIGISGTDGMQRLKGRKPADDEVRYYRNKTDGQIAKIVAARNKLDAGAQVVEDGPVYEFVVQKNQSDAEFLMERAKRIDFDCFVVTDPRTGRDALHFAPPNDGRDGQRGGIKLYQLAYGPGMAAEEQRTGGASAQPMVPNLIEFTPTLTLAEQRSKVTVRGWNPRTKKPIVFTATAGNLPSSSARAPSGPGTVERALGDRREVVVDAPVASEEEARRLAIGLLRERAYKFVTGTGRIAGLPELRPNDQVEIHGLGRRFTGTYLVTRVEHSLGARGFFTSFKVRPIKVGSTT